MKRALLTIILLLLAGVIFLVASAYRSVPPLSGVSSISSLADTVVVTFDDHGIPTITAKSDADAMRALGYLHARDRMFSMDIMRRAGAGRLSEVLGGAALSSDEFLRTLDITRAARSSLSALRPETRQLLDAYVAGINQWIEQPGRPLPPEFRILRYRPEPWTALNTATIARLMSWDLVTAGAELRLAEVAARFGVERTAELFPWYPESGPTIIQGADRPPGTGNRSVSGGRWAVPDVPALAASILASTSLRASNSWVIAGSRTASGKPILANDPHMGLRAPALWYLAAIHAPTLRVAGATLPGTPGVVLGRNQRIAWGLTNISVDDMDYVVERVNADTTQFLTEDGMLPMEIEYDTIRVKGGRLVPFTLRRTRHGPLIEAAAPRGDSAIGAEPRMLALRWNAHEPSDELTAILGVNRAGSWTDFLAAVRGFKSPEQNWIYADADGNIGYTASGNVPRRRTGRGLLPVNGWEGPAWTGYFAWEELPRVFNPREGFIVTANNQLAGGRWAEVGHFELPYRAQRIREMIEQSSALRVADVARMQMDSLDVFARQFKELAAAAAEAAGRSDVAAQLRAWDGTAGGDRAEPSVFYGWYRTLQRLTFDDELAGYRPQSAFHGMLHEGRGSWFDDIRTTEVTETLPMLAERAMREALPAVEGRAWGDIHRTLSAHTLGPARPIDVVLRLNVGPVKRPGSPFTVNVAGFGGYTPPFTNTHAASFRQVVDMADSTTNLVITTGQSGNPLAKRYRDQAGAWLRGELIVVPRAGSETLVLLP